MARKKAGPAVAASPEQVCEWTEGREPTAMIDVLRTLNYARTKAGKRGFRLFEIACCRRLGPLLGEGERAALAVAERFLKGEVDAAALANESLELGRRVLTPGIGAVYARHATQFCLYPSHTGIVAHAVCTTAQQAHAYRLVSVPPPLTPV